MFFDYPADKNTFEKILNQSQPKAIHFMNYEPKFMDDEELLKTFTGMVKYSSHSNNGVFELVRSASFLNKSIEVIESLLNLYEKLGFIKIINKNSSSYNIEFLGNADFNKIIQTEEYTRICDLIEECELFQKSLLEDDLSQFV